MDFIKSVLPPLPKLPKLKKIRNWNGGSLLSLNQFPSLPPSFGLGSFMHSGAVPPPAPNPQCIQPAISGGAGGSQEGRPPAHRNAPHHYRQHQHHRRNPSDICIISTAAVSNQSPAEFSRRDNFGLYALKCDRSAAKRGILLNLPRKLTQAVVGEAVGTGSISGPPSSDQLVHEKFSPCKRPTALDGQPEQGASIRPPPRRRKRSTPPQARNGSERLSERSSELGRWEKNNSELFRIVERESASAARARSAGGVGLGGWARKPEVPVPDRTTGFPPAPLKTRSVDNLLAIRYHRRARHDPREQHPRSESDSESDAHQVRSLRIHPPAYPRRSPRSAKKKSPQDGPPIASHRRQASGGDLRQPVGQRANGQPTPSSSSAAAIMHFKLQRASDFSIENNSDEIEVRFRSNNVCCEEEAMVEPPASVVPVPERHPLPPRVAQLRRGNSRSSAPGMGGRTVKPQAVVERTNGPSVPRSEKATDVPSDKFVPLAEVLRKSIDCGELKRKWINEFLKEAEAGERATEPDISSRTGELQEEVERRSIRHRIEPPLQSHQDDDSAGSVDIFRRPTCDFEEFDELFSGGQKHPEPDNGPRKSVKLSEQITYIDRSSTTSNLCFSSSSFSCASIDLGTGETKTSIPVPPPPPPPPPLPAAKSTAVTITLSEQKAGAGKRKGRSSSGSSCKSTVIIQDYSSKQLQRVRYLSSPSPSRSSTTIPPPEEMGTGDIQRTVDGTVLPFNLIQTARAYDANDVFYPASCDQADMFTSTPRHLTATEPNGLHQITDLDLVGPRPATKTTAATVDAVKLSSVQPAGSAGSPIQHSPERSSPAPDGYSAGRFINPRFEHIPYNQPNINSCCTDTHLRNATSITTSATVAVSSDYTTISQTNQPAISNNPNRVFIIGEAFQNGNGLAYHRELTYRSSNLPAYYQSLPAVPNLRPTEYSPQSTAERQPSGHNGSDGTSRRHPPMIASAADIRALQQPASGAGGVTSPFSVIPDYDEYYNEEGVIII
ncbi:uncharacterized protein LOC131290661 [Anopheles ziemanni]|uniref:uncharacterized protein LOC131268924 n=1 Tax=Anopheles coustani TaxID=139045 RepID=UPI002659AE53|nr:uncharacterized protein LOC131268924 [Anopheles coustani]XP_058175806.1 uncharacterized protein LOC131290661 [Anopheles ziemanni]